MKRFLVRLFGPSDDGTPALASAEVVRDNSGPIPVQPTDVQMWTVARLEDIPDRSPAVEVRLQVAVGTAKDEHDGRELTIWADVELTEGTLRPMEGRWTCSPAEFARRFANGTARLLDGERVVMAGGFDGGAEVSK